MSVIPRDEFNDQVGPQLAAAVGVKGRQLPGPSRRFAWIGDDTSLTVVAGPQEGRHCDLALAYGLEEAAARRLRLILPETQVGATLNRLAWLDPAAPIEVLTFTSPNATPERRRVPSRSTIRKQYLHAAKTQDLEIEFRKATVPLHLRDRAGWVAPLVDWVAARDDLDPAHRKGERAWHCRGQKVLRLTRVSKTRPGVRVQAGIQRDDLMTEFVIEGPLDPTRLHEAQESIDRAVALRLTEGEEFHQADEHWLQAVLIRNPHLVGLELRALREVPAWRRAGDLDERGRTAWGRGYIDLLGLDAHGTVRIVETKLASNDDALFVLQGIDYLGYCEAYREPISRRLDVDPRAPFAISYVVGAPETHELRLNRFVPAQLAAVAPDVQHSLASLTGWWHEPRRTKDAEARPVNHDQVQLLATR